MHIGHGSGGLASGRGETEEVGTPRAIAKNYRAQPSHHWSLGGEGALKNPVPAWNRQ